MEPIKAIIVDDEIEGINALDFMLKQYCPTVTVIEKYQSSVEALKNIKKLKPDLLFLDIKMPNINGLELLELLGTGTYNAIFTTAFDEYILEALRINALDYLKKPIDETALVNAVNRVKSQGNVVQQQVAMALEHFKSNFEVSHLTPFGIKEGNKIKFVKLSEISYCKSDGNFTHVHLSNGENIYSSYSLGSIEDRLPEKYFFRPHREYIINGYQIKEYDKADGGTIIMQDQKHIPISRGRREDLLGFLEGFL